MRGFTLIELLIIVVLIIILAALLGPAVLNQGAEISEHRSRSKCMNHLKNIGLLCKMYAQDFHDTWPYGGYKGNETRKNFYRLFATGEAHESVSDIFLCPSSGRDPRLKITNVEDLAMTDYAYIEDPEKAYRASGLNFGVVSGDAWSGHSDPSDGKWTHPGGSNMLYGDGHVEWRKDEYVGVNGPYTNVK